MNDCLLVFQVAADSWALFQIIGLFHAGVGNLFVRFMIVVEAGFSLWQLVAFVSDWIFYMVVVSIGSGTHSLQFLFIFGKIVLLTITNADLLGVAPLASIIKIFWKLVLVLHRHFFIYFLKWTWDVEPFVLSYAEFVVCEGMTVFLIRIFCTRGWAQALEVHMALWTPGKLRLVPNRKIWPSLLFW